MSNTHGIKPDWMDLSANPGVDFNRYVNGAWIDRTEIPAEYPRWGAFLILREQTLNQLHTLLADLVSEDKPAAGARKFAAGSNQRKVVDFWMTAMDEKRIEAEGLRGLSREFDRIDCIRTRRHVFSDMVAQLHLCNVNVFFGFGAGPDPDNSTVNIAHAAQAGLGLPDREYYLNDDDKSGELRGKYLAHVTRIFELFGLQSHVARRQAEAVLAFETELAKVSMTKVDRRDPDKQRNKMSVHAFAQMSGSFDMKRYLRTLDVPAFEMLNVRQPDFFRGLGTLIERTPLWKIRAYMRWHLLHAAAPYLSVAFVNENFEFYGKTLTGSKELQPRWKRVLGVLDGALGEAVGELYVGKHFPPAAKARMDELVANVKDALRQTISQVTWMSEDTRRNALLKLEAFEAKIGYPDKWEDYSDLNVRTDSYVRNVLRAAAFGSRKNLAKIGQPVDRGEWHMTPQTVNAYYSPTMNQIVFPAAILQSPFFDFEADDAANYGGIGVVIGHEMTHGFDDKGSKYDAKGNLNNWWTDADRTNFMARVERIITQFDGFKVSGGKNVNGKLVAGEAASDLGGIVLAYSALEKVLAATGRRVIHGFSDEQRFFIAFGQLWASKVTPEYEQLQVATDPHPPAQYRVNGTLAHVSLFTEAFGLASDAPMMLPDDKRCLLW